MTVTLSRRAWLTGALSLAAASARADLRVPSVGALRIPLPAPRRATDPSLAVAWSDVWPLGLAHNTLVTLLPEGRARRPLLAMAPAIDRADPRLATLTLRAGMRFSNGAPITAASVVSSWRMARASALGRLALSRLDTLAPFEARGELELRVRLAVPSTLDEVLAAWPLAVAAGNGATARAGVGPFMVRGNDASTLVRNPWCPTGPSFLERVELTAPRARNDELRAFTTGELDASWWGHGLYEVQRAAEALRGPSTVIVGIVPTAGGSLANAGAARTLEQRLAPLSHGENAPLAAPGLAPDTTASTGPDASALTAAFRGAALRMAREPGDGTLDAIAERIVALLDAAQVRVMLVNPGEPCDATLSAVAPLAGSAPVALASLLAAAASAGGDEAGASAIVRSDEASRARVAAGVWGRAAVAVLGSAAPTLHVRTGLHDARFDGAGRLLLGDAWVGDA